MQAKACYNRDMEERTEIVNGKQVIIRQFWSESLQTWVGRKQTWSDALQTWVG